MGLVSVEGIAASIPWAVASEIEYRASSEDRKTQIQDAVNIWLGNKFAKPYVVGSSLTEKESKFPPDSEGWLKLGNMLAMNVDPFNAKVDRGQVAREIHTFERKQDMRTVYTEGAYDLKKLSDLGYFLLMTLEGMKNNTDLEANLRENVSMLSKDDMLDILEVLIGLGGTEEPVSIMSRSYFGRFSTYQVMHALDVVHVMLFEAGHIDKFNGMLGYREKAQQARTLWVDGKLVVERPNNVEKIMEMVGEPETLGEWIMFACRAIRTMVRDGFNLENIDIDSFLSKIPKSKNIGFENVVAIMQNMLVAEEYNPELTKELIDKLQLGQYFDQSKKSRRATDIWLEWDMTSAFEEVFGNYDNSLAKWFSEKLLRYCPMPTKDFRKIIPKPSERDNVESRMVYKDDPIKNREKARWIRVNIKGRDTMVKKAYWNLYLQMDKALNDSELDANSRHILTIGKNALYIEALGLENKCAELLEKNTNLNNHLTWVLNNRDLYPVEMG